MIHKKKHLLKQNREEQLSLFDQPHEISRLPEKEPSPLELIRARFEKTEHMTPEEYKKWIRFLVNWSVRER